ncbi:hypothetical protein OOZ15_18495 [Galbibacter sp. EGI 63066]|uniref:hypothetical protein n=1 Tax=Galbibacter sp. EGI 63066 TaxID=2993559 RepID=UPI002248FF72|nr:hypothetical protein [Galbibacter sp. EGI 63066]MCX2681947.1 hypothetical protein [Galbibacter sp. EGI 63066]
MIDRATRDNAFDFLKRPVKKNIKEYYLQYIPYVDDNGERIIEVKAFCRIPEEPPIVDFWEEIDWHKVYVPRFTDSNCYWRIKTNLDRKEYFDLHTKAGG